MGLELIAAARNSETAGDKGCLMGGDVRSKEKTRSTWVAQAAECVRLLISTQVVILGF